MAVRPPSLRAIAAFEAAARHASFAKAAQELNLSHSAVSHAIRALETRLGVPLFAREGRAVVLTGRGRNLATRMRLGLSLLTDAFEEQSGAGRQRLVVGAPAVIAERLLVPRLHRFGATNPDLQLELRSDATCADVLSGDIDVLVYYGRDFASGLGARLVSRETLFPVASPSLLVGNPPTTPLQLTQCPLIHSLDHPWALWFARNGLMNPDLRRAVIVEGGGVAIEAAKAGMGICLARSLLVDADLASGQLIRLLDIETSAAGAYHALWKPDSPREALLQPFVDWLHADFRSRQPAASSYAAATQDAA